jgi:hypothetical protein
MRDPQREDRSRRLQGLGLVLLVALAHPLVITFGRWASPEPASDPTLGRIYEIITSVSLLCLLAYVLFREGRSLRDLGTTARWSDIPLGLALAILAVVPYAIPDFGEHGTLGVTLGSPLTVERVSLIALVTLVCATAKFELVLRAYLMTEVLALTGSAILAVAASIAVREPYHLYPLPAVVRGLIFSLFYWKTRRATPLVLGAIGSGLWAWLHADGAGAY